MVSIFREYLSDISAGPHMLAPRLRAHNKGRTAGFGRGSGQCVYKHKQNEMVRFEFESTSKLNKWQSNNK